MPRLTAASASTSSNHGAGLIAAESPFRILEVAMQNLPPTPQAVQMVRYIGAVLGSGAEVAARLGNLMWFFRQSGGRIPGPLFRAIFRVDVGDSREALELVGKALLSDGSGFNLGTPWQIHQKIHEDFLVAGGFRFAASKGYQWCTAAPGFALSSGRLEAFCSASEDDRSETVVDLSFRDEWGWTFAQSRQTAERAWQVVRHQVNTSDQLRGFIQSPQWPNASSYPVPFVAAEPYVRNGYDLYRAGRVSEAVAAFSQAIQIDPFNASIYVNRALAYNDLNHVDWAVADITVGIDLDPMQLEPYLFRSEFLERKGQVDDALADVETALRLAPDNAAARQARARLHQMARN
jgi:tetratricopeptide (TPR) repeat protein